MQKIDFITGTHKLMYGGQTIKMPNITEISKRLLDISGKKVD